LEFFIDRILPAAVWPLELTQPLTEMSTRNISWRVKANTTLPHSCTDCHEIKEPQPPGPVQVCTGIALPLYVCVYIYIYIYIYSLQSVWIFNSLKFILARIFSVLRKISIRYSLSIISS
jgi:hypothetical protein